jgi:hypothetical protein
MFTRFIAAQAKWRTKGLATGQDVGSVRHRPVEVGFTAYLVEQLHLLGTSIVTTYWVDPGHGRQWMLPRGYNVRNVPGHSSLDPLICSTPIRRLAFPS